MSNHVNLNIKKIFQIGATLIKLFKSSKLNQQLNKSTVCQIACYMLIPNSVISKLKAKTNRKGRRISCQIRIDRKPKFLSSTITTAANYHHCTTLGWILDCHILHYHTMAAGRLVGSPSHLTDFAP